MEDGGLNGGDTCSPINCGSVSVNNSNQCPSVESFLDDNVLVQCHDGCSLDGKPKRSNFTVTYLKSGERDGEGICAKIVCEEFNADWNPETSSKYMTSRSIGRPKKRWEDDINDFLKQIYDETKKEETRENKISWISAANDRKEWSRLEEKYTLQKTK